MESAQEYYRSHGSMTAPDANASAFRDLPRDLAALCAVVQGVLIHRDIAPWLYSLKLPKERYDLANVRSVREMLTEIRTLDEHPLGAARAPEHRMPCVCRHFATLFASALKEQGVPARVRCGFGAYFNPGRFEDHWVAEYWNSAQGRWILVDAQLDTIQRSTFKPDFDPLDVPRNRFIIAGDAWQMCRAGKANPNLFGLSFINEQGMWWIVQNTIRDLAALNRLEMLPWDVWGMMPESADEITAEMTALLDKVAELTLVGDDALPGICEIYRDDRLRVSKTIFNASLQTKQEIAF